MCFLTSDSSDLRSTFGESAFPILSARSLSTLVRFLGPFRLIGLLYRFSAIKTIAIDQIGCSFSVVPLHYKVKNKSFIHLGHSCPKDFECTVERQCALRLRTIEFKLIRKRDASVVCVRLTVATISTRNIVQSTIFR